MQFEADAAVDKAMHLFWRQGYAATTPQELATELGIGKGSLYNTFESKHALFVQALRRYSALRLDYLDGMLDSPGPIAPRLEQAVRALAGVGAHTRGCVMVNAAAELGAVDAEVNGIAAELFAGIEAAFARAISRGAGTGEFTDTARAATAPGQLLATTIGLSVLAKSGAPLVATLAALDATVAGLAGGQAAGVNSAIPAATATSR